MPLRVAFLNHIGSSIGGGERTLLTFLKHCPADIVPRAIVLEDGTFAQAIRALGIDVEIVPVSPALISTQRERLDARAMLAVPGAVLAVATALRRNRIDVLYTNSMKAHLIGGFAGRLARVPCVMHFHDLISGSGLRLLRIAARLGSRRRIACSGVVSRQIALAHTTVIYGPVEASDYAHLPSRHDARLELGLDPALPTVALVGRINRWKGQDRFVRIAAQVSAERPVQFMIVGSPMFRDADFLPELEAMVRDAGLERVVRFIPWVADVRNVYAATDINVNCSTREPLGRTPAEAAAAGVPSVVFDDSGAAEWMRGSGQGRIVPAWDERQFAASILELLPVAESRQQADSIKHMAQRFEAATIAAQMACVIREAVAL